MLRPLFTYLGFTRYTSDELCIVKNKQGAYLTATGDRHYYLDNKLHRIGGPAVICANGDKCYYQNGKLHRIGSPAVIRANGDKCYYQNGKLHRTDGPAIIRANGNKEYYVNDKLQRIDTPTVEYASVTKIWYHNGRYYTWNDIAIAWVNPSSSFDEHPVAIPKGTTVRCIHTSSDNVYYYRYDKQISEQEYLLKTTTGTPAVGALHTVEVPVLDFTETTESHTINVMYRNKE